MVSEILIGLFDTADRTISSKSADCSQAYSKTGMTHFLRADSTRKRDSVMIVGGTARYIHAVQKSQL